MSHPKFNPALFADLGGQNWVARPEFESEHSSSSVHQQAIDTPDIEVPQASQQAESLAVTADEQQQDIHQPDLTKVSSPLIENAIVVIGSGLDYVWENEEQLSWQLWQNIMLAFGWDESQIVFYDLDNMASEEMVFSTVEEIIELGVESVYTMDSGHGLSEQLADGLRVIEIPDLETMLFDPHAKKSFYQAVLEAS